ncbi:MAG: LLM class flavin-dependent oxidoreductase [Candidatus Hydrothermarchaeota archaeon]
MRISLGLTTSMPIEKSIDYARLADECGYYRIWVGEDVLSREIFTYISVIALKTEKILVGTGVTNPYVRNIAVIASNSAGIQELSKNRFTLGLGAGGIPEVEKMTGEKPKRVVEVMREATTLLRRIFNGEKITYDGILAHLKDYKLSISGISPPKIYFGVRGPKMLALAGEIADGVIFSGSKDYLLKAIKRVEESARKAGRDPEDIDFVLWNPVVEIKEEKDLDLARLVTATIVASQPDSVLREMNLDTEKVERIRELFKSGNYDKASDMVSRDLLDSICIAGSRDQVIETFEEFHKKGFREFVLGPPYGRNPVETIKSFKKCAGEL